MTDTPDIPPARPKPPARPVWVVTRAEGLHAVAKKAVAALLEAGGRLATDRDLEIGGVGAGAIELETDPHPAAPAGIDTQTPNEEG
jgi:hypothetical protein